MGGFRARSAGRCVAALAGLAAVAGPVAPSYADSTVTVHGTAFPDASAGLSLVGCADLYQRTEEPLVPTIGTGPGAAPAGSRSLGWDLAGGNAVGALFPVDSMLTTTTASLAVNAAGHATGVAYAGYQEPADAGSSLLWLGRSELVTPGGAWQTVDVAGRDYTWTKYDMTTRQPVAAGPGVPTTVAGFAATHGGDGPGVYTIGFGCDGTPFSMDRLRVGAPGSVRTYDVEGLLSVVSIGKAPGTANDDEVTITGRLRTTTGDEIPNATMILERRIPGTQVWKPVLVADVVHGAVRATVPRQGAAFYRWRFVERPVAEGNASPALLVDLLPTVPPPPLPTPTPTPTPTAAPTGPPDPTASPSPSDQPSTADPTPTPSATPSTSATPSDGGSPSQSPSASVTDSITADASVPPTVSSSVSTAAGDESASPRRSTRHGTR